MGEISVDLRNTPAPSVTVPKDERTLASLLKAIAKNVLLSHLGEEEKRLISECMFPSTATAGEVVIKQGDLGDNFYIIDQGHATIQVFDTLSDMIQTFNIGEGGSFGELALIYGTPRAATIKATSEMRLWGMDRDTYRKILMESAMKKRKEYEAFLNKIPLLEPLDKSEKQAVADSLQTIVFEKGEDILRQGEDGETFYIIEEGQASVTIQRPDGDENVQVNVLGPMDYFGEMALVYERPRAATVTAVTNARCVMFDKDGFDRCLTGCVEVLKQASLNYKNPPPPKIRK